VYVYVYVHAEVCGIWKGAAMTRSVQYSSVTSSVRSRRRWLTFIFSLFSLIL